MELSALTGIKLSGGFEFYTGGHTRLLDIFRILNDASGVDLVTAVTPVPRSIKKADLSCFFLQRWCHKLTGSNFECHKRNTSIVKTTPPFLFWL